MRNNNKHRRFRGLHNHPFVLPVVTFLLLFFVALAGFVSLRGQTVGASDTLLVSLNVDGEQQILPTRAQTVGDLLARLNITLNQHDTIEPALDTPIDKDNFNVNIHRARPVLVEDGSQKSVIFTAAQSPQAIAEATGVVVYPEDILETAAVEEVDAPSVLREGVVAERVVVDRATQVFLSLYGTSVPIRTQATTVAELLADKGVVLQDEDTLEPDPATVIAPNTQIFVIRVGTQVRSEEQTIPAVVETIEDANLPVGITRVKQAGADGKKIITFEVELHNGAEVSHRIIQEIIASEPIKRVVIKGTKVVISDPASNVVLGQQIANQMGWGYQFNCIYEIFQRESRWNHLARNRNSGAYGIPQALPGSKMGPGWETDPAVQIRWGIGYMANRYGSPCKANSFWQVNRWY